MYPFKEFKHTDYIERIFSDDVDNDELKWHYDEEDRTIKIIENNGWMFQYDNKLPFLLKKDIFIPKGVYHRVIKGKGMLKIHIFK